MRIYRRQTRRLAAGVWTYPVPTGTVVTRTLAGAPIETLAAAYDAARRALYFDTSNALYTSGTLYRADCTVTVGGVTYSVPAGTLDPIFFVHYTPTTADLAPPAPAGISENSATATSVTLNHTPPTDPDYASTTVYAVPWYGGSVVTAAGSGATITVNGLNPSLHYYFIAVASDTAGNLSIIGPNSIAAVTTRAEDPPDFPLYVKFYADGEALPREVRTIDPTLRPIEQGTAPVHRLDLGRGLRARILGLRIESAAPVGKLQVRAIGSVIAVRERGLPSGIRGDYGT